MLNLLMILLGGALVANADNDAERAFGSVILGTGLSKSLNDYRDQR